MMRIFLVILSLFISVSVSAQAVASYDYSAFSQIPLQHNGRVKPLASFARVYLQILSGKKHLPDMSAEAWLAELLLSPREAGKRPVFYVSNPDVLSLFELENRKGHLYSFDELFTPVLSYAKNIEAIYAIPKDGRSPAQEHVLGLYDKVLYYLDLSYTFSYLSPDFKPSSVEFAVALGIKSGDALTYLQMISRKDVLESGIAALLSDGDVNANNSSDKDREALAFAYRMREIEQDHSARLFRFISPSWGVDKASDIWETPWELFTHGQGVPSAADSIFNLWGDLILVYRRGDVDKFLDISTSIRNVSFENMGDDVSESVVVLEERYVRWNLFAFSLGSYILAFLLLLVGGLFLSNWMRGFSAAAILGGLSLHMVGLMMRMMIMGRPPVTNLYESILFVGVVTVVFGVIMELRKRGGSGLMVASACGAILQFLGLRYAVEGDAMGMLQAVLDTNFWLATHVVAITIGYGCCFVGGLIAHIYGYYRITSPDNKERLMSLSMNMRGSALVALFFAALGTILGGIWADQSWGRFWGWDPKENGALLICLWLTCLVHGRIGKIVADDGFAIGMVICNVIVALAWFGVNLLGVGLHSYGFTQSATLNLTLFCSVELLLASGLFIFTRWPPRKALL